MPLPQILSYAAERIGIERPTRAKRTIFSMFTNSCSPLVSLSKPFLDIKKADASELNAWSLETFFDRICGFVWALIIVLTWLPWYIGFASLVSAKIVSTRACIYFPYLTRCSTPPPPAPTQQCFPRICTLLIHLVRVCRNLHIMIVSVAQGEPTPMLLMCLNVWCSLISSAAAVPSTLLLLYAVVPRTSGSIEGDILGVKKSNDTTLAENLLASQVLGVITEMVLVAATCARCALAAVMKERARGGSSSRPPNLFRRCLWAAACHTHPILYFILATRAWTWVNGALCGLLWGLLRSASEPSRSMERPIWLNASRLFLILVAAVLCLMSLVALAQTARAWSGLRGEGRGVGERETEGGGERAGSGETSNTDEGNHPAGTSSAFRALHAMHSQGTISNGMAMTGAPIIQQTNSRNRSSAPATTTAVAATTTTTTATITAATNVGNNSTVGSSGSRVGVSQTVARTSDALLRFEALRTAAARSEFFFLLSVSIPLTLQTAFLSYIATQLHFMIGPLGDPSTTLAECLYLLDKGNPPTNATYSSQGFKTLCVWLGWQILCMASLVVVARGIQDTWDADDAYDRAGMGSTVSQEMALREALEALAAGVGGDGCTPLTLERVGEGVYKRTEEDNEGRRLGLQLLNNPLHDLQEVKHALNRRKQMGWGALFGQGRAEETVGTQVNNNNNNNFPSSLPLHTSGKARFIGRTGGGSGAGSSVVNANPNLSSPTFPPSSSLPYSTKSPTTTTTTTTTAAAPTTHATSNKELDDGGGGDGGLGETRQQNMGGLVLRQFGASSSSGSISSGEAQFKKGAPAILSPFTIHSPRTWTSPTSPHWPKLHALQNNHVGGVGGLLGLSSSHTTTLGVTPRAQTSRGACFICFEAPGNSVFMECGHAGACWSCANTIAHGHSKRQIMSRRAYNAMMSVGGTQARFITLQNYEENECGGGGGGGESSDGFRAVPMATLHPLGVHCSPPLASTCVTAEVKHATSMELLAMLRSTGGEVSWLKQQRQFVRLTPSQMESLEELGTLREKGEIAETDFRECIDGAVKAAIFDLERRGMHPFSLRPPVLKRGRASTEEMLLVTVLTGGSGVCPVCRSPVTNILRLGPDTTTTDGRTVALILPSDAYQWKPDND